MQEKLNTIIESMIAHQVQQGVRLASVQQNQVSEEASKEMEQLVAQMLQAAFTSDQEAWHQCLGIPEGYEESTQPQFEEVTEGINEIFEHAHYDVNSTAPVQVDQDHLDNLADMIIKVEEVPQILGHVVSELVDAAKKQNGQLALSKKSSSSQVKRKASQ